MDPNQQVQDKINKLVTWIKTNQNYPADQLKLAAIQGGSTEEDFNTALNMINIPANVQSAIFVYIGFFKRLIAFMIDGMVTTPFFIIPYLFTKNEFLINGLYFIFWNIYFVYLTGTYGATLGKMVMKIKIIKSDGSKLTYLNVFIREMASYLSLVILGLGYLNVIWDSKKQGWHDKIAKTVVVKV